MAEIRNRAREEDKAEMEDETGRAREVGNE